MLYDLIFLGIIILTVVIGLRKGAAKSLLSLGAFLAAIVLSIIISRPVSQLIYSTFIQSSLENRITDFLVQSSAGHLVFEASAFLASLPGVLLNTLGRLFQTDNFSDNLSGTFSTEEAATERVLTAISPVIIGLISVILSILLFIVLRLILGWFAKGLAKIFRMPLLKIPDSLLGGVFGFFKGGLIVFSVCMLLKLLYPVLSEPASFIYSGLEESKIALFLFKGELLQFVNQLIYRM